MIIVALVAAAVSVSPPAGNAAICHPELWDLNHISGWQIALPQEIASLRPAKEAEEKAALAALVAFPARIDHNIANLREGLAAGYSVPDPVVRRVIAETDKLLPGEHEVSILDEPAAQTSDRTFRSAWRAELAAQVLPAIRRLRSFLADAYLPRARASIGISALPNGVACYEARLKQATTLPISPREVYAMGKGLVAQSDAELVALGEKDFGLGDRAAIIARLKRDPANRFSSRAALMTFSEMMLARTRKISASLFLALPKQPVIIEPLPLWQHGSGIPSHYEPQGDDARPAVFSLADEVWQNETRGAAAVTTCHETLPGHHMQIATARELGVSAPFNDAYSEGWANYAERLSEEAGIYPDDFARMFRRIVLGRSLMMDPGIHAFGWSRARARAFAEDSGLDRQAADDLINRIAVEPGQLTAYEVGGMEILRLRGMAKKQLGRRFDIREFHQEVLERGVVPLAVLDRNIKEWLARSR